MMKWILPVLTAGVVALPMFAQLPGATVKPLPVAEAKKFVGNNVVLVGKVAEVNRTEQIVRLNFEEPFPKQVFTAVVFARSFKYFTNLANLEGKTVEITGKVSEYRDRPQIILTNSAQLRVTKADKPATSAK